MEGIWTLVKQKYFEIMGPRDPRTSTWAMVGSPWPTILLMTAYVTFSKYLGPWLMRNRKPFELRIPMVLYNFTMVFCNAYCAYLGSKLTLFDDYSVFGCQLLDRANTPKNIAIISIAWWAYILRFVDFLDTVFFVLRKKDSHITFLHLFHHTSVPLFAMLTLIHHPGGMAFLLPIINCTVHAIMYTYYGLAAIGPKIREYLWWKRYLTLVQMAQFLAAFLHISQLMFVPCDVNQIQMFLSMFFMGFFFLMFLNFYVHEYRVRRRLEAKMKAAHEHERHNGNTLNGNNKHATTNGSSSPPGVGKKKVK